MNAPSLKTGSLKRLVVAIGTTMPLSFRAFLKSRTMRSRSAAVASMGIEVVVVEVDAVRAELAQQLDGDDRIDGGRTNSPNGSRPRLPTVQRPNVNLSQGFGV